MEWSFTILFILFAVAMLAGWVDTLAGGGGLISLPAMLLLGVPPVSALATNKAQGVVGTLTASVTLLLKGHLRGQALLWRLVAAGLGAALGSWLVQGVDTGWLEWLVPVLLISVAAYFWFTPNLGSIETKAHQSERQWTVTWAPAIGFYDGFFGPGAGSFYAATGVAFRGQTLLAATISAKPLNFMSNVVSLAVFSAGGQVVWIIGFAMMLGQVLGAFVGSHTMLSGGARLIRPIVITMCVLMSVSQVAQSMGWISLAG
ncbi:TSUP family transporter [Saccharospirillum alexandrii]|uniref:TSUP family transporter n=1 Tax=Saccharospirillum alexandrii TaxID=2448477 RepID=UPI000FD924E4|nr:TSUP family transporter [Saccharospirillum alexandrii]